MTPRADDAKIPGPEPSTAPVNIGDKVVIAAVVESLGHDDEHVFVRIGRTLVQVPVIAIVYGDRIWRLSHSGPGSTAASPASCAPRAT